MKGRRLSIVTGFLVSSLLIASAPSLTAAPPRTATINGIAFVVVSSGPFIMGTPPEQCVRAQEEPGLTVEAKARAREYCMKWETPPT